MHSFRRKLWTSTYLSLESYLPASKRGWCREIVEMKIWNLQSLLVCPIILWRVSSTEDDWIFGWWSRLASLILILCSPFTLFHCGWTKRLLDRWTPWIQFLRVGCWWWRIWIYKKVSRFCMCVPNAWRPFSAARNPKRTAKHFSGIGWGGNDTGRLVTWEFPLRIDSASWNSFESLIQFISFCNSCIRPESSKIVSWSSTNLRLAIVSKVELWNFFNSSISLRLIWWASRNSKIWCNNCPWRSCWSRRSSSSAWAQWSSSRWDSTISLIFVNFFCHNQLEIRVC